MSHNGSARNHDRDRDRDRIVDFLITITGKRDLMAQKYFQETRTA